MSSCIEIDFLLKIMEKMESGDIYESDERDGKVSTAASPDLESLMLGH
ncbi:unnamed protein product [Larinioides sclopetarius]|uniref:Uncharacterized protein n=1 Tax=Larinioides sclopetarius TaxID=280406 RepID=A0AAV1Z133_9ARAC